MAVRSDGQAGGSDVKLGDKICKKICIDATYASENGRSYTGEVVYIHLEHRFYRLRFEIGDRVLHECYFFQEVAL